MSKYQNAKKPAKRTGWKKFFTGMLVYALVFLCIVIGGLAFFWNYMDAYEQSRPEHAIDAYIDGLTAEHICDVSQDVLCQVDSNIQTAEQVSAYVREKITDIHYARKASDCTDTRQVFVLQVGSKVIGQFSIEATDADRYGFTLWSFESETFDISTLNLFESGYEVVVPSDHKVIVNGFELDDSYLVEDKILYDEIKEYYKSYDLPYRVKYGVGSYAGTLDIVILDAAGNETVIDADTEWSQYFNISDEKTIGELDQFVDDYVECYVAFTGSTRENCEEKFDELIELVVKDSDFAFRLTDAVEGLKWGQSQGNTVVSLVMNHRVRLDDARFMCDFTYEVDTKGREGVVRTTTHARIVIVETDKGFKVESMNVYG